MPATQNPNGPLNQATQLLSQKPAPNGKAHVPPTPPAKSAMELELERLKAENEALRAKANHVNRLTWRVSPKGAISIYGLGKFPVTLYREQFARLMAAAPEISTWIETNPTQSYQDPSGTVTTVSLKTKGQE